MYKQLALVGVLIACAGGAPKADSIKLEDMIDTIFGEEMVISTDLPATSEVNQNAPKADSMKLEDIIDTIFGKEMGISTDLPATSEVNQNAPKADSMKLEDIIDTIFGKEMVISTDLPATSVINQTQPIEANNKSDDSTTNTGNEECTVNGLKGTCVRYYLCDTTGVKDLSELIDIHKRSVDEADAVKDTECVSYLDACCTPGSIVTS